MSTRVQATTTLRVGVSALFDPADTPHARTFLRALCVARNAIADLQRIDWRFLDDGADPAQGAAVARQFVQAEVDLVIGHFSSDAAISAAEVYRQAGIPLLTPAATVDCLTPQNASVFRFCPSDRRLAADLVSWLKARRWQVVHIDADNSAHGQALARAIARAASHAGLRSVASREQAQVEIFAGRLRTSRVHWQARRATGSLKPLVLTDDAASLQLGRAAPDDHHSYVIGFGRADGGSREAEALHRALFQAEPETYYHESLLMLHAVARLAARPWRRGELTQALQDARFDTPLGAVAFEHGELRGACTQVWRVGTAGLTPLSG